MPRIAPEPRPQKASPLSPRQRSFPRPWTIEPDHSAFVVYDTNGVEMLRVPFVAEEMRAAFPYGLTHEEALTNVRFYVGAITDRVGELEGED